jgi:hypothetical protein
LGSGLDSAREIREYYIPDFSDWRTTVHTRRRFNDGQGFEKLKRTSLSRINTGCLRMKTVCCTLVHAKRLWTSAAPSKSVPFLFFGNGLPFNSPAALSKNAALACVLKAEAGYASNFAESRASAWW